MMLDDFLTYIGEQSLFHKNEHILLAVSGGVDSVVLAHLFHQSGHRVGMAHCNFSLRGKDSDEDQLFVENLAKNYGVSIHSIVFDTNDFATKHKLSAQMAARHLRYQWFEELVEKHSYKYLGTAHHHSDSLETVLFNFTKGTGISGMRGILPRRGHIIRPLLFATKKEILQYAKAHNLLWREDASNVSDKYHRNYIRGCILPKLSDINPSFENTAKATLQRLKDAEEIVLATVEPVREQLYHSDHGDHFFDKEKLKALPGRTTMLHLLIKSFGFNYAQCSDIISHIDKSGKLFLSKTHQGNIDRTYLIISPLPKEANTQYTIEKGVRNVSAGDLTLHLDQCPVPDHIPSDKNTGCFDLGKIMFPLTIRTWRHGDRFCPLGMCGQKKVSDFLIDAKVPINLKGSVKVLVSNDEIIWVIGHRIDNRYKVENNTGHILRVRMA